VNHELVVLPLDKGELRVLNKVGDEKLQHS
jgi:hypothetical protein